MSRFGEEDEYFESNNFSGGEGSQAEEVDDHEYDNESDKKQEGTQNWNDEWNIVVVGLGVG